MRDPQPSERRVGSLEKCGTGPVMRKNARTAEETREHHVAAGRITGTGCQQIGRDDAEQRAQLKNVPALAAENRDGGAFVRHRVAFTRDGLDQRGLAAAIRTQDTNMLARLDAQGDVLQRWM